jgi:hypothetical protein
MHESYYQNGFAKIMKGNCEYILDDQTRVDIITDTFAIEVDFAKKWAESIGQSLYYAEKTHRKAGVLLLVDGNNDNKYIKRLMILAIKYNITVWLMNYNDDNWQKVIIDSNYHYNQF